MSVTGFLEELEKEKRFELQFAGHRYISLIEPRHRKLDLPETIEHILKDRVIRRFWIG